MFVLYLSRRSLLIQNFAEPLAELPQIVCQSVALDLQSLAVALQRGAVSGHAVEVGNQLIAL